MRMMMKVTIPVAVVSEHGKRTTLVFFDLKDPSQIPVICEPLFGGMNAEVELMPAMNAQDLQAGLSQLHAASGASSG